MAGGLFSPFIKQALLFEKEVLMSSRNKGLSRRDFIKSTTVATLALTGSTTLWPGTVRADGKSPSESGKLALKVAGYKVDRVDALMGENSWPYGIAPNRTALEALFQYSYEQGLATRRRTIEELFHPLSPEFMEN